MDDNKIVVQQSNNWYRLWHPAGFIICEICMPADGQYMIDSKAIAMICRALSIRYRIK